MRLPTSAERAGLVALAYGPFLASAPGKVSADSKQALYLDPGGLLDRATDLWDPSVGAGTVPHQQLGYLVPAGPWFWAFDRLGAPDWVAQRLWWGTLTLVALLGARWLLRTLGVAQAGALVGALVYGLTPYQLAFTARMSVLLLPWAALPWLVGLTARAVRGGGWRWPALLALVLALTGGVNASSLLLVALGPLLWLLDEARRGRPEARRALAAAGRIALLAGAVSLWWLVGVRLQGAYGLPVLQLTENLRTVAEASAPDDVLRGMGNWFFYGRDRTGFSLDQAASYQDDGLVEVLTFAVPALALGAAVLLRWAHRTYFVALVVVGTVLAVGSWPHDDPSFFGRLWRAFADETSIGLAFRNSPRVVPLVVLGLAGLLGAAVSALDRRALRVAGAGVVAVVALGALLPAWQDGFTTDGMLRPEEIPAYWLEAAADLDEGGSATRVLEVPGSSFAAYRWGTTVDPITPLLIDRPYLAREVLPDGTAPTANLLAALDRRIQLGTLEADSLAPVARLLGVGTVVVRADLERAGRFDTQPVEELWASLTDPLAPGLRAPSTYGPPGGAGTDPALPSVGLFEVGSPEPIVRVVPHERPVVLAGDGDGIVDAAAAGLLDGHAVVLTSPALDDEALDAALAAGADLVLTDSHRRRIETWFYSIRATRGPTERAGIDEPDPTGYDFRLEPYPGASDATRTVAEHVGGTVAATAGRGPEGPEDRPVHAVDGDPETAWRVGGEAVGARLTITFDDPVAADELRLVQPVDAAGRSIAAVVVHLPGQDPLPVALGPASRAPEGQAVPLPGGPVAEVGLEITGIAEPPGPPTGAPIGFAEVRVGRAVIEETIRLPVDLLERAGARSLDHRLDIVLTRLRWGPGDAGRVDEEPQLHRRFELPTARELGVSGRVAIGSSPEPVEAGTADPPPPCREDVLRVDGAPFPVRIDAVDGRLTGCGPLRLEPGSHRIEAVAEDAVVDRLVLSSAPGGLASDVDVLGPTGALPPEAGVLRDDAGAVDLTVAGRGEPVWVVLGQSSSDGWSIDVDGGTAGARQLVNGYANGWVVDPGRDGQAVVHLRWTPQRLVPIGIVGSVAVAILCLAVVARTREEASPDLRRRPSLVWPGSPFGRPRDVGESVLLAVLVGGASALVAPVSVGALVGAAVIAVGQLPALGYLLAAGAPLAVVGARLADRPSLAWMAVGVAVVSLVAAVPSGPPAHGEVELG